jgi:hypothetical protein
MNLAVVAYLGYRLRRARPNVRRHFILAGLPDQGVVRLPVAGIDPVHTETHFPLCQHEPVRTVRGRTTQNENGTAVPAMYQE